MTDGPAGRLRARWRRLVEQTRPVHPETARALAERWAALPEHVRTPAQRHPSSAAAGARTPST
jgi:hypothetical protein